MDNNKNPANRKEILPNAESIYRVGWDSLPLSCPMPQMSLWNSHPRVYLPILEANEFTCMYCGATYILEDPIPGEKKPFFADPEIEQHYDKRMERVRRTVI